jgi:hypothetical protein
LHIPPHPRNVSNKSSKKHVQIPNLSIGASQMELITSFPTEFCHSAARIHWTTGPVLYEKLLMHLQVVTDLDAWNIITTKAPQAVVVH